jgi:uncharacterized protein (TIGR03086 family)
MTILESYLRSAAEFDAAVAAVPVDGWDAPSACADWSRRDVLGHVVWGQDLLRLLLTGAPLPNRDGAPGAPRPGTLVPSDPVGTWRAARAASAAVLTPEAAARTVDFPPGSDLRIDDLLHLLFVDFLAHAWDIDRGVRLDPELVEAAHTWSREAAGQRVPGGIGPELEPPAGADGQARFLAHLGRTA